MNMFYSLICTKHIVVNHPKFVSRLHCHMCNSTVTIGSLLFSLSAADFKTVTLPVTPKVLIGIER